MPAPLAHELAVADCHARHRLWRSASSGLNPQVVAIVAVLLLIRALSTTVSGVIYAVDHNEFGAWFSKFFTGYCELLVMATPMLVVIMATASLGPQRGAKRVAALIAAAILSTGAGLMVRILFKHAIGISAGWEKAPDFFAYLWPRYALFSGMLIAVHEFYRREVATVEAAQQAGVDRAALERETAEARLQVLQAQIEPHFLFNTLANVRRLYDKDPPAGRTMLVNLMRYLEVALPRMREDHSTLERDAQLLEAFLRIQQIRMGQRLAFRIDIPAEQRAHPTPPMMLLTLVENAIKHGLNPSPDGGLIRVTARAEHDRLSLSVADTGVGFAPGSGNGTGLANIRARLAAQFGDRARLALENNELGGVTATITLPLADAA